MFAHFGLAFAPPLDQKPFGTPQTITRRLIKQKARHHPLRGSDTLSAHGCRFCFTPLTAVLFTFPSRYLFTIGRQRVFSLTQWSAWIHTKFHLYRVTQELPRGVLVFDYRSLTFYGAGFHPLHLTNSLPHRGPTTPQASLWFGLVRFRSPLLTESHSLSFPPVTEMFHFTGCRSHAPMYSERGDRALPLPGYPIRKSTGQRLCAAHRSLSQLVTSFIACWHQGIHHVPFVA